MCTKIELKLFLTNVDHRSIISHLSKSTSYIFYKRKIWKVWLLAFPTERCGTFKIKMKGVINPVGGRRVSRIRPCAAFVFVGGGAILTMRRVCP